MTGPILDALAFVLLLLACLCCNWPALMLALIGAAGVCVTGNGGPRGGCCP